MKAAVTFNSTLIAPCGMNCATCIGYQRKKDKCPGCRIDSATKRKSCANCRILNCDLLAETNSKFCYDCKKFPCTRLKNLDKRYQTKYKTGLIQNLHIIKQFGMSSFLSFESNRRICANCGSVLSVHRDNCLTCETPIA